MRPRLLPWLALAGSPALLAAAPQAPTRLDLADAYLRFEEALLEREPKGAELAAASLAFDRATARFFLGDAAAALAELDAARAACLPAGADRGTARDASSLRLELDPPHGRLDAPRAPAVRLTRLYEPEPGEEAEPPPEGAAGAGLRLALVDGRGRLLREAPVAAPRAVAGVWRIELGGELELGAGPAAIGGSNLVLELRDRDGRVHGRRPWPVLRHDPAHHAAELRARARELGSVEIPRSNARALATYLDRVELLDPAGRAQPGARLATDLARLEAELEHEWTELAAGRDPYRGRPGALWRVARLDGVEVPLWIVAPERAPGTPAPPLVLAFHGAGGEESQWLEAYGRGALAAEARARGWLLVLPRTYPLVGSPSRVAALLADLAHEHPFDPSRVLALGHSLGAAAAAELANHDPRLLAGLALFAGGANLRPRAELPRTLFVLGSLDRIVPPAPCRRAAELVRAAGAPVAILELEHHGHTTLVPAALPAAFALLD